MESYAINVIQNKKKFSTQNIALSPVLRVNQESPRLKEVLYSLEDPYTEKAEEDDLSVLCDNTNTANNGTFNNIDESCANIPYQLIKSVRKETSTTSYDSQQSKNSRLSEMRKRVQCQLQINGESSDKLNRQQLIKAKSEKFKKDYINAMKDSFETKYALDIPLGQGMHASVFKCFNLNDESKSIPLAVKIMREDDEEKTLASKKEFEITKRLNHTNIVKSIELFINDQRKEVHQVMEFIDGKEILDQIAEFGAYKERDAQHIFKQVMEGIAYLHENGICHRDVKPSNILVTKDQKVYIADFNVAREKTTDIFRMMTRTGTLAYSAPEIFTSTYYDEKVDIWSAGIVLYMMLSGHQPFEDENVPRLISRITLGEYDLNQPIWAKISEPAKDLISQMLEISPNMRLSASEVLYHPWLRNYHNQQINNQQELHEVKKDFMNRKCRKDMGHFTLSQVMNVGSIQEEILKKGLEIANMFYIKSSSYVAAYDRLDNYSRRQLNDDISSSTCHKHQTQPSLSSNSSSDNENDEDQDDDREDEVQNDESIATAQQVKKLDKQQSIKEVKAAKRRISRQQDLLEAIEKFKAL